MQGWVYLGGGGNKHKTKRRLGKDKNMEFPIILKEEDFSDYTGENGYRIKNRYYTMPLYLEGESYCKYDKNKYKLHKLNDIQASISDGTIDVSGVSKKKVKMLRKYMDRNKLDVNVLITKWNRRNVRFLVYEYRGYLFGGVQGLLELISKRLV